MARHAKKRYEKKPRYEKKAHYEKKPRHAEKKPIPVKWIVVSIVSAVVVLLVVTAILLIQNGLLDTIAGVLDASSEQSSQAESTGPSSGQEESSQTDPTQPQPLTPSGNFARPEQMRGAWLTPGVDYLLNDSDTADTVKQQIDAAFATLKEWQFNTVILPMMKGDQALYPSPSYSRVALADFDPLAYILQSARDSGLYVYGVLDCHVEEENGLDPTVPADMEKILREAAAAAGAYAFDGYLIEDYSYALGKTGNQEAYEAAAAGVELDQFTADRLTAMVAGVVQEVRKVSRDLYVGLLSNGVWAHKRVDERGSDTNGIYEDMTDGHADTLSWVQDKLVDFVLVRDYSSTSHSTASFSSILDWWSAVCRQADMPLYIAHAANRLGSENRGWNSSDQLAKQYLACLEKDNWLGSAFESLATLKKDPSGAMTMLIKAMDGSFMDDYVSNTLTISTPAKTTYTTYESKLAFSGSCNPNFPLTVNGEPVELTEHGYFNLNYDLKVGLNTYKFEQNGKVITYKITYELQLLQSVDPAKNLTMDGGSVLIINAIVRKGSTAYAMIGGTRVPMKEAPLQSEDATDQNSDFINYSGSYTLPAGIEGQAQKLGNVEVFASYNGTTKSLKGGAVTVEALPISGGNDTPLPPVVGDLPVIPPSSGGETITSGEVILITSDYAETFDGSTTDDYSRPVNAYLPKGTTDKLVRTVGSYYLLGSGRRVYTKDAKKYDSSAFTANTLAIDSARVEASYTRLDLKASWRIPYNVQLLPQDYYKLSSGVQPQYNISSKPAVLVADAQQTDYVDITFYYTTSVGAAPDFSGSPIIKSAEWIKGEDNTYILRLHLNKKGGFYGYSVVWDKEGVLHFSFKHPAVTSANSSSKKLSGVKIAIDPGHGANSGNHVENNTTEKALTLKYSLLLRDKLEELGATVVMSRTTDVNPAMEARTNMARNNGTDLLLSIHMNAGGGQGASYHYFNEYSYLVAQRMYEYVRKVEDSYGLGKRSVPVTWSPFFLARVHDTAAVLVECGFYDNATNAELLLNPTYQEKFTTAMVEGILDYFARISPAARTETSADTTATAQSDTLAPLTVSGWFMPLWDKGGRRWAA